MKLLFTGDINFRGKDNMTFEESEKILTEVLPYAKKSDFVTILLNSGKAFRTIL